MSFTISCPMCGSDEVQIGLALTKDREPMSRCYSCGYFDNEDAFECMIFEQRTTPYHFDNRDGIFKKRTSTKVRPSKPTELDWQRIIEP